MIEFIVGVISGVFGLQFKQMLSTEHDLNKTYREKIEDLLDSLDKSYSRSCEMNRNVMVNPHEINNYHEDEYLSRTNMLINVYFYTELKERYMEYFGKRIELNEIISQYQYKNIELGDDEYRKYILSKNSDKLKNDAKDKLHEMHKIQCDIESDARKLFDEYSKLHTKNIFSSVYDKIKSIKIN